MKAGKLIDALEQLAPPALALSWDNPGLICGRRDREVRKVLVALDAAEPVVERALEEGCDLILTHHPMIFKPVPKINNDTALGRKLIKLLGRDICCYAMHTNFDIAPGCMADLVCEKMGAEKAGPLEPSLGFDGLPLSYGVGFIGTLPEPLAVPELARRLRQQFDLKGLVYYDAKQPVSRIAVCPGSGRGMLETALGAGAQVLITGDMGHHDGIDALDEGISLIDAAHFGLEHLFVPFMADYLRDHMPELTVVTDEGDLREFL